MQPVTIVPPRRWRSLRTVGGIGAILTCPCHVVPLVLLIGGTAGGAWLARHLSVIAIVLLTLFAGSLWLLFRVDRGSSASVPSSISGASDSCETCPAPVKDDVLRRS